MTMSVLNAKVAKKLRKVAGYKNQSKTPGVIKFPGIQKLIMLPVLKTRVTIKRESQIVDGRWSVKTFPKNAAIGTLHANGIFTPYYSMSSVQKIDEDTGAHYTVTEPDYLQEAVSKPAKYDITSQKGMYRELKKSYKGDK